VSLSQEKPRFVIDRALGILDKADQLFSTPNSGMLSSTPLGSFLPKNLPKAAQAPRASSATLPAVSFTAVVACLAVSAALSAAPLAAVAACLAVSVAFWATSSVLQLRHQKKCDQERSNQDNPGPDLLPPGGCTLSSLKRLAPQTVQIAHPHQLSEPGRQRGLDEILLPSSRLVIPLMFRPP